MLCTCIHVLDNHVFMLCSILSINTALVHVHDRSNMHYVAWTSFINETIVRPIPSCMERMKKISHYLMASNILLCCKMSPRKLVILLAIRRPPYKTMVAPNIYITTCYALHYNCLWNLPWTYAQIDIWFSYVMVTDGRKTKWEYCLEAFFFFRIIPIGVIMVKGKVYIL